MTGGKAKRRRKQAWRAAQGYRLSPRNICVNCGEPGPHFIPPGFGSPGMFMCKAAAPVSTTTEGKAEQ